MAGILVPLCEFELETAWHILAFIAYGICWQAMGMCLGFIFQGYQKYQGGATCKNGKLSFPPFALPKLLFFILWIILPAIFAMAGWNIWYFEGRWCDSWITLLVWAAVPLVLAFWPVFLFVFDSPLLAFLVFAFLSIWCAGLIIATIIDAFNVVALICEGIFLFWVLYNALWTFVLWRNKNYGIPKSSEIAREITAELLGTSGNGNYSNYPPQGPPQYPQQGGVNVNANAGLFL